MLLYRSQTVARVGLLIALAFALSYIEHLIPLPLPVGVKLGLANVVTLVCLVLFSSKYACFVLCCRCVLVAMLFGSVSSLLFSLAGGMLALGVMILCMKGYPRRLSLIGVSVAGAAAHHIGQITVAVLYLQTQSVGYYLPILLLLSIPTGILTGTVATMTVQMLGKTQQKIERI